MTVNCFIDDVRQVAGVSGHLSGHYLSTGSFLSATPRTKCNPGEFSPGPSGMLAMPRLPVLYGRNVVLKIASGA